MTCARCCRRLYCSSECQAADWRQGHKNYCRKSGEINFDIELGETVDKGIGMFALRRFKRGDKIFVERLIDRETDITPNIQSAISLLEPKYCGDLSITLTRNCLSLNNYADLFKTEENADEEEMHARHMCVTLARVNHSCIGNSSYQYIKEINAVILVASTNINPQEEITFPYVDLISNPSQYLRLRTQWNFDCSCPCCMDQSLKENMSEISGLLSEIKCVGLNSLVVVKGKKILSLFESLQLPLCLYARVYYRMFSCCVAFPDSQREAAHYISEALRYAHSYFGDITSAELQLYQAYCIAPESHCNYLCGVAKE